MSPLNSNQTVPLSVGRPIPLLGFGTWELAGDQAYDGVRSALEIGYRHIDTATGYANEDRVGTALRDSGVDRGEVFITTKCPPERAGRELETLDNSLSLLDVDFVDLWLVHWPPNGEARPDTWRGFIEALQLGKTKAIGVSNYSIDQIDELIAATGQAPALNQIPWSPFSYDPDLATALAARSVVLEGYSPLKRSRLDDPALAEIASAHGKTPAQVILRWHLEHEFVVIPRSSRRERIEQNFALYDFELGDAEIARIDALSS
jgi:2,5-diketo-D-gluconate reductase A